MQAPGNLLWSANNRTTGLKNGKSSKSRASLNGLGWIACKFWFASAVKSSVWEAALLFLLCFFNSYFSFMTLKSSFPLTFCLFFFSFLIIFFQVFPFFLVNILISLFLPCLPYSLLLYNQNILSTHAHMTFQVTLETDVCIQTFVYTNTLKNKVHLCVEIDFIH